MKQSYTAIYSTEKLKNIHYSFKAKDNYFAMLFCSTKFEIPLSYVAIFNHKENQFIHLSSTLENNTI